MTAEAKKSQESTSSQSSSSENAPVKKEQGALSKEGNEKKSGAKGKRARSNKKRPRRRTRGPDNRPPRFDLAQMHSIATDGFWQSRQSGTVTDVTDVAVFVEVERGSEAVKIAIKREEFPAPPSVGAEIPVRILNQPSLAEENVTPSATGSWAQAVDLASLDKIQAAAESKTPVEGVILAQVKGGYSVALGATRAEDALSPGVVRAFLPRSQATTYQGQRGGSVDLVGETSQFEINELELERANVVVGRKRLLAKAQKAKAKETWSALEVGQRVVGTVRAIMPYGAFLDVGGVDGLLHVSDLSWTRQPRVNDILHVGQTIDCEVTVVDKQKKKLKVGLKQLTENPWAKVTDSISQGGDIEGDVVAITDFGAFVAISDGVEGLIHLSEISWDRVKHPSQKFKIGQRVKARVLEADSESQRLSLSTKALEQNPYERIRELYPDNTVAKAQVKSFTEFGAFVELDESVDGLLHIGELSWTDRIDHPSEVLTIGQELDVMVLSVDVAKQRVACSLKRLSDNPWTKWESKFAVGTRHKLEVVRVSDGGATLALEDGLTGFCPTRELATEAPNRAQDMVKTGDNLEVEVIRFEKRTRRMTLSAKRVVEGETRKAYDEYKKQNDSSARMTIGDALKGQLSDLKSDNS